MSLKAFSKWVFTGGRDSIFLFHGFYGKFQLNPRYEFHLYMDCSPCGNARIFSPDLKFDENSNIDIPENEQFNNELRIKLPYDSASVSYFLSVSITQIRNDV